MTRIDFYILQSQTLEERLDFTCRLTEKAVNQGNTVSIMAQSHAQSHQLDELLWSFKPESFVPHCRIDTQDNEQPFLKQTPVVICHENPDPDHHDVMINLGKTPPNQFSRFSRLMEIVIQNQQVLQATRESYKFYNDRGYPIFHHKL